MLLLKIYLFAGLVAHKVVWEYLRMRSANAPVEKSSASIGLVKVVKIAILIGILIQIWLPDLLPIANETARLRAAGTTIFTFGLITAVLGRLQLGDNWANIETGQVLTGQRVVENGLYSYIRHPIYVGDLMLLMGLELALNSWLVVGAVLLMPVVLMKAIAEERMLGGELPGYSAYCKRSKRFIPFVY